MTRPVIARSLFATLRHHGLRLHRPMTTSSKTSSARFGLLSNPWILGSTIFLQAACLVHYVFANLWSIEAAGGPSMLPTLSVWGDWIVHDHTCSRGRGVGVGDLVSFKIPSQDGQVGVKRIVGMPGDYVLLGTPGEKGQERMLQVPPGHCYLAGDNIVASRDSRNYGPVPLALIGSKVVARAFPWSERQWLDNSLRPVEHTEKR
ncbi:peptidase s24-like domain-containing protein [Sarocladium implicatum]|nr:peptidase s24-like domain-containing protein [Sarocladium implicatum]